jgi:hypothetical protein
MDEDEKAEDTCKKPGCNNPRYRAPGGGSNLYCKKDQYYMTRGNRTDNRIKDLQFLLQLDQQEQRRES